MCVRGLVRVCAVCDVLGDVVCFGCVCFLFVSVYMCLCVLRVFHSVMLYGLCVCVFVVFVCVVSQTNLFGGMHR